jgi:hypothetical protein
MCKTIQLTGSSVFIVITMIYLLAQGILLDVERDICELARPRTDGGHGVLRAHPARVAGVGAEHEQQAERRTGELEGEGRGQVQRFQLPVFSQRATQRCGT